MGGREGGREGERREGREGIRLGLRRTTMVRITSDVTWIP